MDVTVLIGCICLFHVIMGGILSQKMNSFNDKYPRWLKILLLTPMMSGALISSAAFGGIYEGYLPDVFAAVTLMVYHSLALMMVHYHGEQAPDVIISCIKQVLNDFKIYKD